MTLHHHHPPPPPPTLNSMSAISQLLLARFWPNFKGRFLGPSWRDSKCQSDICPGNICPCDICPYQLLLTWFWSNFKSRFLDHLWQMPAVIVTFVQATFVLATFVHITNVSAVTDQIGGLRTKDLVLRVNSSGEKLRQKSSAWKDLVASQTFHFPPIIPSFTLGTMFCYSMLCFSSVVYYLLSLVTITIILVQIAKTGKLEN